LEGSLEAVIVFEGAGERMVEERMTWVVGAVRK
jgi:hypothetical protein